MPAGTAAPLGAAVAAAGGVRAATVISAAGVLHAFAVRQLVTQAALQAAALPRQLRRVQAEVLLFRHLDRDGLERAQPGRAAERTAAGAVAAEHLRLVADADLPHLDPHVELRGQIADELPEVHARFRRVIEDEARAVEDVLHLRQLHREPALADLELRHPLRL